MICFKDIFRRHLYNDLGLIICPVIQINYNETPSLYDICNPHSQMLMFLNVQFAVNKELLSRFYAEFGISYMSLYITK